MLGASCLCCAFWTAFRAKINLQVTKKLTSPLYHLAPLAHSSTHVLDHMHPIITLLREKDGSVFMHVLIRNSWRVDSAFCYEKNRMHKTSKIVTDVSDTHRKIKINN